MNGTSNVVNQRTGVIALPPKGNGWSGEKTERIFGEIADIGHGIIDRVEKDTGFKFLKDESKHLCHCILDGAEIARSRRALTAKRKSERQAAANRGCSADDLEKTNSKKARMLLTRWRMNAVTHDRNRFVGGFAETESEYERSIRMYVESRPRCEKWLSNPDTLYASGSVEVRFGDDGKPRSVCFPRTRLFWLDSGFRLRGNSPMFSERAGSEKEERPVMDAISKWTGMEYLGRTRSFVPAAKVLRFDEWCDDGFEFSAAGMTDEFRSLLADQGFLEENCWCGRSGSPGPHVHCGFAVLPVAIMEDGMKRDLVADRKAADEALLRAEGPGSSYFQLGLSSIPVDELRELCAEGA